MFWPDIRPVVKSIKRASGNWSQDAHPASTWPRLPVYACLARATAHLPGPSACLSFIPTSPSSSPSSTSSSPTSLPCPSHPSPESSGSVSGSTSPPPSALVSARATHSGQLLRLSPSRVMRAHIHATGMACTSSVVSIPSSSQILFRVPPRIPTCPSSSPMQRLMRVVFFYPVQRQEEFYLKLERAKQQE